VVDFRKWSSSRVLFEEFIESTTNLFAQVDINHCFTYVNHGFEKFYNIPKDSLIGESGFVFTHPEDLEFTKKKLNDAIESKRESFTYENRQVLPDGEVRYLLWTINLHYDENYNYIYSNGIAKDITDIRGVYFQLEEEMKKASNYLNVAANIVVVIDSNYRIQLINDRGCELIGLERHDILDKDFLDFVDLESERNNCCIAERKCFSCNEKGYNCEFPIVRSNGERRHLLWNLSKLEEDGEFSILASGEDITDRLVAENNLRKSESALRSILNASDDVIVLLDTNGDIVDCNNRFAENMGKKPDEIRGRSVWDVMPGATLENRKGAFAQCIMNKESFTYEDYGPNGWHETTLIPLFNENSKVVGVTAFANNVDTRKESEKLSKMNEKRHKALAVMGQMYEADMEEIMAYALESAIDQTLSSFGNVTFYDKDENKLKLLAVKREGERYVTLPGEDTYLNPEEICGMQEVLDSSEAYICNDDDFFCTDEKCSFSGISNGKKSMLIPLLVQGEVVIIAYVAGKEDHYNENDVSGLTNFLDGAWRLIERKEIEDRVSRMNQELEEQVQERTAELQESEERFRAAFQSTVHGMVVVSPDRKIIEVNDSYAAMLGYEVEELLGKTVDDFTHSSYQDMLKDEVGALVGGKKKASEYVKKYITKSGEVITVSVNAALVKSSKDNYIVGHIINITEAEKTRRERQDF
jgi:PAS domain S-box-containing protein